MVRVILQSFDGEIPRMEGHYLPEKNATEASNCKLTNGCIRPIRDGLLELGGLVDVKGIFLDKFGTWHTWTVDVWCVPAPVDNDRLYAALGQGEPEMFDGTNWIPLHFARRPDKPLFTTSGTLDPDTQEIVKYAYTLVSDLGEETPPSDLSSNVQFSSGITVHLTGLGTAPVLNNRTLTTKRIYRSQTSAAGITDLYFIAEVPATQDTFDDTWGDNDIQEPCPTIDSNAVWTTMRGLTSMPNGMMAGFNGKTLHFCEPYLPHSWPRKYWITLDYDIVGLVSTGTSLIVLTAGQPYIVQGLHPESMAVQRVESVYPCVSRNSIVDMGYAAIYSSTDGLVQISETGAQIVSKHLWSKDDWENIRPHQVRAGRYGNAYVFSSIPIGSGGPRMVFTINLDGEQPALSRSSIPVEYFYNDAATNNLYFIPMTLDSIQAFDKGAVIPYVWKSKLFRFAEPINFSSLLVELSGDGTPIENDLMHIEWQDEFFGILDNATWTSPTTYEATLDVNDPPAVISAEDASTATLEIDAQVAESFTFKIYGNGSLIHSTSNNSNEVQRIPDGEYREWQFALEGTAEVLRAVIGQSSSEVWT